MQQGMEGKRIRGTWCWVLAALLAGPAVADGPRIEGRWVGSSVERDTPVAVRLDVQGGGASRLELGFGAPHACSIGAWRSNMFPGEFVYDVAPPAGGKRCDALYPGTITLLPDPAGGLRLVAGDGTAARTYPLRRPGSVPPAGSDDPRPLLGSWLGQVVGEGGARIGVRLEVAGVEPGDPGSSLRYGPPRQCTAPLVYEGALAAEHYFSIPGSPGGYCDHLAGGYLRARLHAGRLEYGFQPDGPDCRGGCTLERATDR